MDFINCPLYRLQSKRGLKYLLKITTTDFFDQNYVLSSIHPYIDKNGKPRLIEAPNLPLKSIQSRIKNLLSQIVVPDYVFSGVRGKSYVDNATYHFANQPKYVYKLDLSSFFPSISRDRVYCFFLNDLLCSPDVSEILTNLTTIDLDKKQKTSESVHSFMLDKNIYCYNHLITGSPSSPILSFLVNHEMFTELNRLSEQHSIIMSLYVDDITFSCFNPIPRSFKEQICRILLKNGYSISSEKTKYYTKQYPKLITGIVVNTNGVLTIKNSLRHKIIIEFERLRANPADFVCRQRLRGLLAAARQINNNSYPSIWQYAYAEKEEQI